MLTLYRSKTEAYYYDEHRRIQGKYRSFSYVTEELLSTITYVDNIRHGEFQTYFDSGEVKMRGTFI